MFIQISPGRLIPFESILEICVTAKWLPSAAFQVLLSLGIMKTLQYSK